LPYDEAKMMATLKGAGFSDEYIARFRGGSVASTTRKNKSRTELKDLMRTRMKATGRIDMVAIKEHPLFTDRRLTNRLIKEICAKEGWEYEAVKQGKTLIAYRRKMDLKEVADQVIDMFPTPGPQVVLDSIDISDVCAEHGTNARAVAAESNGYLVYEGGDKVVRVQ